MSVGYFLALPIGRRLKPADKFCKIEDSSCERPDLFAFEFVCLSVFIWQSFISIRSWHIRGTPMKKLPNNAVGRVFGYCEESEVVSAVAFAFQLWDLMATPFLPEFCSKIMLGHHFLAATVSFLVLEHQYLHYYAVFYLALSEVSSIPLAILSIAKYFPPTPGTATATIAGIAPILFAIAFTYYRVILWIQVSYTLWNDCLHVLSNAKSNEYRPGKNFVLYTVLASNFFLTLLQLYWFCLIAVEVLKLVGVELPELNPGFE